MILGEYPCCGRELSIGVPEKTPVYVTEMCPHCGQKVWHRISRLTPTSWTEAAFLAEHDVDEETKQVKLKNRPEKPGLDSVLVSLVNRGMANLIAHDVCGIYPDGVNKAKD